MSLAAWAERCLTGAHNLRPKTRRVYGDTVDALGELGEMALGRLTPAAIDQWLATGSPAAGPPRA